MSRVIAVIAALMLSTFSRSAIGEPKYKLRISTAAPEGTTWANTIQKFTREVAKATNGDVQVRIYYGGIAGDEREVHEHIKKGNLDGAISGGPICAQAIPSMRALDIIGLFQNQAEAEHVVNELRTTLTREAHDSGYALLATGSLGPRIVFSREPITSMAELRKTKLWSWSLHEVFHKIVPELQLTTVGTPLVQARKAFDERRVDGFITTPVAALSFQWYVDTKYITDLRVGYLVGCFLVRESVLDALPAEHQRTVRNAAARLGVKVDEVNRRMDQELLGNIYERRGLKKVPVSAKFRAEFFEASRVARQRLGDALVPRALLDRVTQLLADFRAEHR
jgi:TRAP-type C4-dicarboxylate transport system substrate-binding protein